MAQKVTGVSDAHWRRRARRVLALEAEAVARQAAHVDAGFLNAARRLAACRGRVVVMGIGKSGLIGRKVAATLSSTGTPSFFVHPTEGLHGDLGMLTARDLVLALSHSGETEELSRLLAYLRTARIPLIAMTSRPRSRLGRAAQCVLRAGVDQEACPYNIAPTSSTTAMLALGDALALVVMEMKGFTKDDFARLHPGGSLGKKLTLRVGDIMRTGSRNPRVRENRTVADALVVMTRTRLGAASVVDRAGRLAGVFTDGDLRRRLPADPGILGRRIARVMTRSPRTVSPGALAAEVAPLFKRFGLDNLPVVDARNRPVGIVDEKDFIEEGLAA
jgi:arabinose-5-phosphate isomerase